MNDLRKLFNNYIDNKRTILICDREIANRKMELDPSYTSHLSFTPKVHSNNSKTEELIIKFEEDETIKYWENVKRKAELDNKTVETFIDSMEQTTKEIFIQRFLEGKKVPIIAAQFGYGDANIYRIIKSTFSKIECLYKH